MLSGTRIAARVRSWIKREKASPTALGEHMGIVKSARRQAKSTKVRLFLERLEQNVVNLNELDRVADFFDKTRNDLVLSPQELYELRLGSEKRVASRESDNFLFLHNEDQDLLEPIITRLLKK